MTKPTKAELLKLHTPGDNRNKDVGRGAFFRFLPRHQRIGTR
jgi:hypothetical protein